VDPLQTVELHVKGIPAENRGTSGEPLGERDVIPFEIVEKGFCRGDRHGGEVTVIVAQWGIRLLESDIFLPLVPADLGKIPDDDPVSCPVRGFEPDLRIDPEHVREGEQAGIVAFLLKVVDDDLDGEVSHLPLRHGNLLVRGDVFRDHGLAGLEVEKVPLGGCRPHRIDLDRENTGHEMVIPRRFATTLDHLGGEQRSSSLQRFDQDGEYLIPVAESQVVEGRTRQLRLDPFVVFGWGEVSAEGFELLLQRQSGTIPSLKELRGGIASVDLVTHGLGVGVRLVDPVFKLNVILKDGHHASSGKLNS